MPKTLAAIQARDKEGPRLAGAAYFFSWVRTEAAVPGRGERIRLRRAELSGWEPEYPKEEYLSYLESLDEISSRADE
jgi:hypothetical protein